MNPLHSLSDADLLIETRSAAVREKTACLELLHHLSEVDRRRLYSARGYSSLWEYVHHALGYSEAQASERVAATRLMTKTPEIQAGLQDGRLTLTSTAKLAAHVRREKCTVAEVRNLFARVADKSTREVERILASVATVSPSRPDQVRPLDAKRTQLTLEVDSEFMALLTRAKELVGHPGTPPREVLKRALREFVERRERIGSRKPSPVKTPDPRKGADASGNTVSRDAPPTPLRAPEAKGNPQESKGQSISRTTRPPKVVRPRRSRYVPVLLRGTVRTRSGDRCEYVDRMTGRRCEARHRLEINHIRPFALGGPTSAGNLRHLCRNHNVDAGIGYFGSARMRTGRLQNRSR